MHYTYCLELTHDLSQAQQRITQLSLTQINMIITKFLTPTVHTQQGDVRLLDGAVLAAGASPLGKAHPLVLHGKQMKEALVKERGRLEFEMREAAHVRIRASAHSIKRTHIRLHIIVR